MHLRRIDEAPRGAVVATVHHPGLAAKLNWPLQLRIPAIWNFLATGLAGRYGGPSFFTRRGSHCFCRERGPETNLFAPMHDRQPRNDFAIVLFAIALVGLSFIITLAPIQITNPILSLAEVRALNPSPLGYTWSLSLWVLPSLALLGWFLSRPHCGIERKAFWLTVAALSTLGILLDVMFGLSFFKYENRAATLGLHFPGYRFGAGWIEDQIPIEEIGFYVFGILAVLLVYIWGCEGWLEKYSISDALRSSHDLPKIVSFHVGSSLIGVVLAAGAIGYHRLTQAEGFPGYMLFLIFAGITPSILFYQVASPFINWRAFSLTFVFALFISSAWEATLAIPYRWWGYHESQMLGIFIRGFSDLPIEQPLLWMMVTWTTVVVYETAHTVMHMSKGQFRAIFEHVPLVRRRIRREEAQVAEVVDP